MQFVNSKLSKPSTYVDYILDWVPRIKAKKANYGAVDSNSGFKSRVKLVRIGFPS